MSESLTLSPSLGHEHGHAGRCKCLCYEYSLGSYNLHRPQFNLGWKLALVYKGIANVSLLNSYNEERLPVAKAVLIQSTAYLDKQQSFKASKPDVSIVTASAVFRQLGVNYRWSSIVVDEQEGRSTGEEMAAYLSSGSEILRAGDRAPDAPGLQAMNVSQALTSLFTIFQPTHHTVLLFNPTIEQVQVTTSLLPKAVREAFRVVVILSPGLDATAYTDDKVSGVDYILLDTKGHANAAYYPVQAGFSTIVVRPDGVLGAVVKDSEGIEKYLSIFFGRT